MAWARTAMETALPQVPKAGPMPARQRLPLAEMPTAETATAPTVAMAATATKSPPSEVATELTAAVAATTDMEEAASRGVNVETL